LRLTTLKGFRKVEVTKLKEKIGKHLMQKICGMEELLASLGCGKRYKYFDIP